MSNIQDSAIAYSHIPLQDTSVDIWSGKYQLHDMHDQPVDLTVEDNFVRVATDLASVEKPQLRNKWFKAFMEAFQFGATPAGRIMSNAGASAHKTAVSLINCTVSGTIEDSMDGIMKGVWEAALTLKSGCGIGYEFSTMRPKGAFVSGAGAQTSGPLPFMDVYDKMCFTVRSAGDRRGAQMGTFDVTHPDVMAFIKAKREDGRFKQFNLSLLITDKFIQAVKDKAIWQPMWKGEPFGPAYPAEDLWNAIMESNYNFAEPGFLLIDRINQYNNLWFCEHMRATNPCGEQPLPAYGACLLGSQNLTKFVLDPFTPHARFDFKKFYAMTRVFTRMLDNVVEHNNLPLPQQREEIMRKRRHGMGYFGVGSMCAMLGIKYGSPACVALTDEISKQMAFANFEEGVALAIEKGEAPVLTEQFTLADIAGHLQYNRNFKPGKRKTFTGRELFLQSHYFDAWREDPQGRRILALMKKHGSRFSHATSIAPTGTIAFSFGNNASNGIEPSFSHAYVRNVIRPGRNSKEQVEVNSYEYLLYKTLVDALAQPTVIQLTDEQQAYIDAGGDIMQLCRALHVLPPQFAATAELTPKEHIDVQAAAQKWIDSSISKTINVPMDISYEDFKDVYMYAVEKGLKGCTTYRPNPTGVSMVLVNPEDQKASLYTFTLEDGSVVQVRGDEMVEYNGEVSTAMNLHDALRDGYYGKH